MNAEVRMKVLWSLPIAGLTLLTACSRTVAHSEPVLSRPCQVTAAADAAGDRDIAALQEDVRHRRAPARAIERLGYYFVARARLSNDAGYYTVAEQAAACLDSVSPGDPAALLLRGHTLHQLHRFAEAEAIARQLVAQREFVLDYGLLGDTLMEQGRIEEASAAYQRMIDLKPFYQSYTRAAHLRWLKGDVAGAVELMQSAVKAASPRDPESIAWAYARLAMYELQRGRLADAERMTASALQFLPDYAAALLAQGRIELARGHGAQAAATLARAVSLNPLPEYRWTLADALRQEGRAADALVIETDLQRDGAAEDPRTFSLYLSTRREHSAEAVRLARRELEKRADVFTLDALAWSLASAGELREASALMTRALAEGTEDARLFVHAAAIAAADGRRAEAARWRRKAHGLRFTLLPSELDLLARAIATPPPA